MSDITTMNAEELDASLAEDSIESTPEEFYSDDFETLPIEEQASVTPSEQIAQPVAEATKEPEQSAPPTLESLQEQLSKMEARLKEKDSFIGKQANVIGELKKQGAPPPPKAEMPSEEEFMTKPIEALKKYEAARKIEAEQQQALEAQQFELVTTRNREITSSFVPEFDKLMGDIEAVLTEEDGLSSELIAPFKQNPYATPPEVLIQLAKRVQQKSQITALKSEVDALKAENAKLQGKSTKILNNVENSARQTTQVRPPTSTGNTGLSSQQRSALSYEELLEQLKD